MDHSVWRIELFGGVRAVHHGRIIGAFKTQKTAALLVRLAHPPGIAYGRDQLADLLWPEADCERARQSLRDALSTLRSALRPSGSAAEPVIRSDRHTVGLLPQAASTDLSEFDAELAAAAGATGPDAIEALRRAVALCRGVVAPSLYDDWVLDMRATYAARYVQALTRLVDSCVTAGDGDSAISYAAAAVEAEPLEEGHTLRLMQAAVGFGRRSVAARAYSRLVCRLRAEMDELPSEDLRSAARDLAVDPSLERAGRAPVGNRSQIDVQPATRSAASGPLKSRLPSIPHLYIGGEPDIGRVLERFRSGERLVTLTGPGGVGKSSLSLEAGKRLVADLGMAAYFVPLDDLTDAAAIHARVRQIVAGREMPAPEPLTDVAALLADGASLVILDNMEQFRAAGAVQVGALMARVPGLRVLVTSRSRLGLPGERVLPLRPLAVPDADADLRSAALTPSVRLFVDRATLSDPDFRLHERNCRAVIDLVRRLEGLPLAIVLAAARCGALSPEQVNDRLARALHGSGRAGPAGRQGSLTAALAWSIDLLPQRLRAFFARLCVFAGDFAVDAVLEVCTGAPAAETEDEVLEDLFRLCCCSLLETVSGDMGARFRMLHVVRSTAPAIVGAGELDAAARRYADRYTRLAAEVASTAHRVPEAGIAVDSEAHHFGAALDWLIRRGELEPAAAAACHLTLYWATRGRHADVRSYFDRLLSLREGLPTAAIRQLLYNGAWLALGAGDHSGAEQLASDYGKTPPAAAGENLVSANSLKAQVAYHAGDYGTAARLYDVAISAARRMHSGPVLARNLAVLYGHLGECMEALGQHRLALELCEAALVEAAAVEVEPYCFVQAAGRNAMRGDVVRAGRQYREAMAAYERLQQSPGVAITRRGLGMLFLLQGDLPAARTRLEQSLADWRSISADADSVYDLLGCLGNLLVAEGRPEEAVPMWCEALAHWREKAHPRWTSVALCGLARAELAAGHPAGAERACSEAMTVITGSQFEWTAHSCAHTQAQIAHALGDAVGARVWLARSLTVRIGFGCLPWLIDSLAAACDILAVGNAAEARTACRALAALRRWLAHPLGPVERPIAVATAAASRCAAALAGPGAA